MSNAAATVSGVPTSAVELPELRCERPFPEVLVQVLVGAARAAEDSHARRWVERQREFAGLFPGAEVVELPDAKHLIAADRPDAVAAAVLRGGFPHAGSVRPLWPTADVQ